MRKNIYRPSCITKKNLKLKQLSLNVGNQHVKKKF